MNLEEALPEYIQDDDLWGGFMRPKVEVEIPSLEEFEVGDHAGMLVMGESEPEMEAEASPAPTAGEEQVEAASQPDWTVSSWQPSKENAVWDWAAIEDRIVDVAQEG